MEAMLKIQGAAGEESIEALSLAIQNVMIQGYNCHMDQSTVKAGIATLREHAKVGPVGVHNCNFQGGEE